MPRIELAGAVALLLCALLGASPSAFAGDPVAEAKEKLKSPDQGVRAQALLSLEKIDSEEAFEALLEALGHGDGHVRLLAVMALGARGNRKALEPLRRYLEKNRDLTQRLYVLGALAQLSDAGAVTELMSLLGEGRRNIDSIAAERLAAAGRAAVPELIRALASGPEPVRPKVAEILGRIKDGAAVGPLLEALGQEKVRLCAVRALGEIGHGAAAEALRKLRDGEDQDRLTRVAAAFALTKISGEDTASFTLLLESLEDRERLVVLESLEALAALKNPASLDPLLAALERNLETGDLAVRCSLARVLGILGDRKAVKPLIRAFRATSSDLPREFLAEVLNGLTGKKVKGWENSKDGKAWED